MQGNFSKLIPLGFELDRNWKARCFDKKALEL